MCPVQEVVLGQLQMGGLLGIDARELLAETGIHLLLGRGRKDIAIAFVGTLSRGVNFNVARILVLVGNPWVASIQGPIHLEGLHLLFTRVASLEGLM